MAEAAFVNPKVDNQQRAKESEQELRRQAQEVGCFGLVNGEAFSVRQKRDVSADEAVHEDGPFICRTCLSDAVVRKCVEKRDHFAHQSRLSPAIEAKESELHKGCLEEICEALKMEAPGGDWQTNRPIKANEKLGVDAVRPDISGKINGQRIVIEAQASQLSLSVIIKRSVIYSKWNVPILWLVPLKADFGNEPFRPRLYERYLHAMYFGRVYYWRPDFGGLVLPVHYGVAKRHIPFSEWYDKDAEQECKAGGYDKPYKVIKRPVLGEKVDIVSQFFPERRSEFRPWNERKTVPPLMIWKDRLSYWWDTSEDEAFRKRFEEDNLPKERRKKHKPKAESYDERWDPLTGRFY
ncbi:MAG TPA: competence protein CoiA family protein [Candidatus Paceibacterota bacterium]|nr:competence protein CoiA family protein [Candidatus Paceibacterota bacterium]